ncbi:MAG: o-succinylbenzoate synthase [Simkaniaceae bacterium]|nr:o-succinylbenzoate synthase [Simkaniaceae bacterium]
MKIQNFDLYVYKLPLKTPLKLMGEVLSMRFGMILELTTTDGKKSYGEIAPLPHMSKETVIDAVGQLKMISHELKQTEFSRESWTSEMLNLFAKWGLAPHSSVLFGLESAFFKLFEEENTLRELPVSALLSGNRDQILEKAEKIKSYNTAKLKIGQFSPLQAIEIVQQVKQILPKISLRLDVGRKWSLEEAVQFGKGFYPNTFEYIEEPVQSFSDLATFHKKTLHSIAIDETLRDHPLLEVLVPEFVQTVVLKPTLHGGAHYCMGIAKMAKNRGMRAVYSSSYESTLGLADIARLDARTHTQSPVGIDTFDIFEKDLFLPQLNVKDGKASIAPSQEISLSELKPMKL